MPEDKKEKRFRVLIYVHKTVYAESEEAARRLAYKSARAMGDESGQVDAEVVNVTETE